LVRIDHLADPGCHEFHVDACGLGHRAPDRFVPI
jgi:hypothetical protein